LLYFFSRCFSQEADYKKGTVNRPKSPPRQRRHRLTPAEVRKLLEDSDSDIELTDNNSYDSDEMETESGSDAAADDDDAPVAPTTSQQPAGHQSATN